MTQWSLRLGNSGNGSLVEVMTSQQLLDPHEVCSISGIEPSISHVRLVLMCCTCFDGTQVYSA
jgi:hypothetical protein